MEILLQYGKHLENSAHSYFFYLDVFILYKLAQILKYIYIKFSWFQWSTFSKPHNLTNDRSIFKPTYEGSTFSNCGVVAFIGPSFSLIAAIKYSQNVFVENPNSWRHWRPTQRRLSQKWCAC